MQQKTKGEKMERYQTLLNQLKELNEIDLKKNYNKDNYNMKLLLDGVQWQIDNFNKNQVISTKILKKRVG